ncbi:MAG: CRISPR-associated endonuclease Cas2 [Nitrosopumilus sp.]|nr:CRISPR-associated endonuclease Cas2 [Nitrosopumilus sp.]
MYYAVYNITNNSTRNSIICILKNQGFVRIQKSVFCGSLSGQNKKDMTESIKSVVDKNDSFYLILTCNRCFGKIKIIGKGFDKEYVSDKKPAVVL